MSFIPYPKKELDPIEAGSFAEYLYEQISKDSLFDMLEEKNNKSKDSQCIAWKISQEQWRYSIILALKYHMDDYKNIEKKFYADIAK